MDSRSYIKLTGNLTSTSGGTTGGSTIINMMQQPILTCYACIGAWDMAHPNASKTISIPSGIAVNKIRNITATICSNGGDLYPLEYYNDNNINPSGRLHIDVASRSVILERTYESGNGFFIKTGFYGCSVNRGYVGITYSNIVTPSGTTGIAANVQTTNMCINSNIVTCNGNDTLSEYGVLYTQNPFYSTPTALVYGNIALNAVYKVCVSGNVAVGLPYNQYMSSLTDNTLTYYRMYTRNSESIGYGVIRNVTTQCIPAPTTICAYLDICTDFPSYQDGFIQLSDTLGGAQWVQVNPSYNQSAQNAGDTAALRFYCKPCGSLYFTEMYGSMKPCGCAVTTFTGEAGPNFFCEVNDACTAINCFRINKGDCICFTNCVQCGTIGNPLCSEFTLLANDSSVGLTFCIANPSAICIPHP